MSSNDYTSVTSGALKLKGTTSTTSKSHKKKRLKPALPSSSNPSISTQGAGADREVEGQDKSLGEEETTNKKEGSDGDEDEKKEEQDMAPRLGKTDAEIRHEERRRRKVIQLFFTTFISYLDALLPSLGSPSPSNPLPPPPFF